MGSKITLSCTHCNSKFERFPSQIKKYKYGAFCSNACIGLFRSEHLTGSLGANFRDGFAKSKNREYISVLAPWHPNKVHGNYIYLHRLVAEAKLGRYLTEDEIVHHIDGNPENNHWDNLEVMTQSEHAKEHIRNGTVEFNYKTRRLQKGSKNG